MDGGRRYLSLQLEALYCIIIKLISQQGRKSAEFQNKDIYFLNYSENANFTKKINSFWITTDYEMYRICPLSLVKILTHPTV